MLAMNNILSKRIPIWFERGADLSMQWNAPCLVQLLAWPCHLSVFDAFGSLDKKKLMCYVCWLVVAELQT